MPRRIELTWTKILIDVREQIATGYVKYICYAIRSTILRNSEDLTWQDAEELDKKYCRKIQRQLKGCDTYEGWVCTYYPEVYDKMRRTGDRSFRKGRLLWIDDMIRRANGK